MVAPITGPFVETHTWREPSWAFNPEREYYQKRWYRQKPPYNLHLNYLVQKYRVEDTMAENPYNLSDCPGANAVAELQAYYNCYNKFRSRVSDSANWLVSLAELNQSIGMMTGRFNQMIQFVTALRRLDFKRASKILALPRTPKRVSKKRVFADNFLEYHFGWAPLIQDIGTTIDILQKPYPQNVKVSARAKEDVRFTYVDDFGSVLRTSSYAGTNGISIQALVSVSNPNLFLANQMGFVNPLTVLWEVVPYSFVLDWFVNVGDVLAASTDYLGVTFVTSSLTSRQKTGLITVSRAKDTSEVTRWGKFSYSHCARNGGIGPGPSISLKPFKGFSLTRGIAAISLLLQKMR